jgi:hypothetical protein
MKNAIIGSEQSVFLNGHKLKGVSSVDGSYSVSLKPVNIFGASHVKSVVGEVLQGDFSITRNQSIPDSFLEFTGDNKILRGSINYGTKVFGFETGYLNSYSYSLSVGSVPQTNLGITVYGDIGSGLYLNHAVGNLNASGISEDPDYQTIRMGDVSLTCDGSTTNRIVSFDFSVSPEREPIYIINSDLPFQVSLKSPVETTVGFTMEVDDFSTRRLKDSLTSCAFDTISFAVRGQATGANVNLDDESGISFTDENGDPIVLEFGQGSAEKNTVFSFESSRAKLVSTQFEGSAEDVSTVKLTYIVFNNK